MNDHMNSSRRLEEHRVGPVAGLSRRTDSSRSVARMRTRGAPEGPSTSAPDSGIIPPVPRKRDGVASPPKRITNAPASRYASAGRAQAHAGQEFQTSHGSIGQRSASTFHRPVSSTAQRSGDYPTESAAPATANHLHRSAEYGYTSEHQQADKHFSTFDGHRTERLAADGHHAFDGIESRGIVPPIPTLRRDAASPAKKPQTPIDAPPIPTLRRDARSPSKRSQTPIDASGESAAPPIPAMRRDSASPPKQSQTRSIAPQHTRISQRNSRTTAQSRPPTFHAEEKFDFFSAAQNFLFGGPLRSKSAPASGARRREDSREEVVPLPTGYKRGALITLQTQNHEEAVPAPVEYKKRPAIIIQNQNHDRKPAGHHPLQGALYPERRTGMTGIDDIQIKIDESRIHGYASGDVSPAVCRTGRLGRAGSDDPGFHRTDSAPSLTDSNSEARKISRSPRAEPSPCTGVWRNATQPQPMQQLDLPSKRVSGTAPFAGTERSRSRPSSRPHGPLGAQETLPTLSLPFSLQESSVEETVTAELKTENTSSQRNPEEVLKNLHTGQPESVPTVKRHTRKNDSYTSSNLGSDVTLDYTKLSSHFNPKSESVKLSRGQVEKIENNVKTLVDTIKLLKEQLVDVRREADEAKKQLEDNEYKLADEQSKLELAQHQHRQRIWQINADCHLLAILQHKLQEQGSVIFGLSPEEAVQVQKALARLVEEMNSERAQRNIEEPTKETDMVDTMAQSSLELAPLDFVVECDEVETPFKKPVNAIIETLEQENEELHQQLQDLEELHKNCNEVLSERMRQLESDFREELKGEIARMESLHAQQLNAYLKGNLNAIKEDFLARVEQKQDQTLKEQLQKAQYDLQQKTLQLQDKSDLLAEALSQLALGEAEKTQLIGQMEKALGVPNEDVAALNKERALLRIKREKGREKVAQLIQALRDKHEEEKRELEAQLKSARESLAATGASKAELNALREELVREKMQAIALAREEARAAEEECQIQWENRLAAEKADHEKEVAYLYNRMKALESREFEKLIREKITEVKQACQLELEQKELQIQIKTHELLRKQYLKDSPFNCLHEARMLSKAILNRIPILQANASPQNMALLQKLVKDLKIVIDVALNDEDLPPPTGGTSAGNKMSISGHSKRWKSATNLLANKNTADLTTSRKSGAADFSLLATPLLQKYTASSQKHKSRQNDTAQSRKESSVSDASGLLKSPLRKRQLFTTIGSLKNMQTSASSTAFNSRLPWKSKKEPKMLELHREVHPFLVAPTTPGPMDASIYSEVDVEPDGGHSGVNSLLFNNISQTQSHHVADKERPVVRNSVILNADTVQHASTFLGLICVAPNTIALILAFAYQSIGCASHARELCKTVYDTFQPGCCFYGEIVRIQKGRLTLVEHQTLWGQLMLGHTEVDEKTGNLLYGSKGFDSLVQKGLESSFSALIKKDVLRVIGWNEKTKQRKGLFDHINSAKTHEELFKKLCNVLYAASSVFDDVEYCQGMSFPAFHVLYELGLLVNDIDYSESNSEAKAFHVFFTLIGPLGLGLLYNKKLHVVNHAICTLNALIEKNLPALNFHFQRHDFETQLFAIAWFESLFAYIETMPIDTISCIWDIFIADGSFKIFFQVAVAILQLAETELLEMDFEGIIIYLQRLPNNSILEQNVIISHALQINTFNLPMNLG